LKVIAIVPTLNEEKGLPLVLAGLKKQGVSEIVVVDGHSTDRTVTIAKKAGARIILQEGKGKGAGFVSFISKYPVRNEDIYVMLDGDGSYDPSDLPRFVEALKKVDVVAGVRSQRIRGFRSLVHVVGGFVISVIGSALYGKWDPDICTGYWGFRGSALRRMCVTATKFDLEANLFSETCKKSLRFKLVPIVYEERVGKSKLHFYDGMKIVEKLVAERFA